MATTKAFVRKPAPCNHAPAGHRWQSDIGATPKEGSLAAGFRVWRPALPDLQKYLTKLESLKEKFLATGAEVVAVSSDPEAKALAMAEAAAPTLPVAYGLSIEQMRNLGLYFSHPRSPEETDQPFPEPGMFAVNAEGKVQLIDISNTPFNRSDLDELLETVEWIQENDYPIR